MSSAGLQERVLVTLEARSQLDLTQVASASYLSIAETRQALDALVAANLVRVYLGKLGEPVYELNRKEAQASIAG